MADLEVAGFTVGRVRESVVQPPWYWWRIGASILRGGRELGRVWGEHQGMDWASLPALVSLRLWATRVGLCLEGAVS